MLMLRIVRTLGLPSLLTTLLCETDSDKLCLIWSSMAFTHCTASSELPASNVHTFPSNEMIWNSEDSCSASEGGRKEGRREREEGGRERGREGGRERGRGEGGKVKKDHGRQHTCTYSVITHLHHNIAVCILNIKPTAYVSEPTAGLRRLVPTGTCCSSLTVICLRSVQERVKML